MGQFAKPRIKGKPTEVEKIISNADAIKSVITVFEKFENDERDADFRILKSRVLLISFKAILQSSKFELSYGPDRHHTRID